jgi:hypothetical protein
MQSEKHKITVGRVMKLFNSEFPGKFDTSEQRVETWNYMLDGIDGEILLNAAMHLAAEPRQWPPSIGELRTLAISMAHGELAPPSASEAWERVLRKVQRRDVELTELDKSALARVGSIWDLRHSTMLQADRARFLEAYDAIVKKRDEKRNALPSVAKLVAKQAAMLQGSPQAILTAGTPVQGMDKGEAEKMEPR